MLPITCRRGAPLLPPTKLLAWNFRTQTTIEPIRPALRLAPPAIPQGFLITVTPLNLHKCFLTGGFLQTAVSDAPRTPPEIDLPPTTGASDTALAFLDSFRFADHPPRTVFRSPTTLFMDRDGQIRGWPPYAPTWLAFKRGITQVRFHRHGASRPPLTGRLVFAFLSILPCHDLVCPFDFVGLRCDNPQFSILYVRRMPACPTIPMTRL